MTPVDHQRSYPGARGLESLFQEASRGHFIYGSLACLLPFARRSAMIGRFAAWPRAVLAVVGEAAIELHW